MDARWIISKYVFYLPATWVIFFIVLLRLIFKTKGKESNKTLYWYTSFVFLIWAVFFFRVATLNLGTKIVSPYSYVFYFQILSPIVFYSILFYSRKKPKTRWIFLTLLSINFGYWFEKFVIIITSIHRDYISTESTSNNSFLHLIILGSLGRALIGLILGGIIFYVFEYRKKKHKQIETLDSLD